MKMREVPRHVTVLLMLSALIVLPLVLWAAPVNGAPPSPQPFAAGRILVKFQPGTGQAARAAFHRAQGGQLERVIPGLDVEVVRVPVGAEQALARAYTHSPMVAYAEPDYAAYALDIPNDLLFGQQWGLDNTGQPYKDTLSGTVDADIDAPEAWAIATGGPDVTIAIVDTGIDQDHEDLVAKVDGNVNFTDSDTWDDRYGHGTHVAGAAAAATNNGTGVAGVCPDCRLLNVKVLNDQGMGYNSWIATGIRWATDHGARVINLSLGGSIKSRTLEDAVNYAWDHGVVLACAAGNDGNSKPTYPGKYEPCIAVAATDANDQKASFSTYSARWVDVAAPGVDILSTFPNHDYAIGKALGYDYGSGTSMAAPHVAGLAGLVWSTAYGSNAQAVRERIESTADPVAGTGTYWIHGRINACNAVGGACTDGGPEPPPGGSMYVAAIDWAVQQRGPHYRLLITVTIRGDADGAEGPVSDAAVTMDLHDEAGGLWTFSGTTDADGQVTFRLLKAQPGTYTATVTGLTHATSSWDKTLDMDNPDTFSF